MVDRRRAWYGTQPVCLVRRYMSKLWTQAVLCNTYAISTTYSNRTVRSAKTSFLLLLLLLLLLLSLFFINIASARVSVIKTISHTVRWARLVLGWVTACGRVNHLNMYISVCNQSPNLGQISLPSLQGS